jgi:ATP-dependent Zn protease
MTNYIFKALNENEKVEPKLKAKSKKFYREVNGNIFPITIFSDTCYHYSWLIRLFLNVSFKLKLFFTLKFYQLQAGVYDIKSMNQVVCLSKKKLKTDKLIKFSEKQYTGTIDEIVNISSKKETYQKIGFTFKRGILLYGEPGNGKSALLNLIIQPIVSNNGICLYVKDIDHFKAILKQVRNIEPERLILVILEDLDTLISGSLSDDKSTLLSLLEGQDTSPNTLFLATTNFPEELEGNLINRPGRFDRVIFIDNPGEQSRREYLQSLGLELTSEQLEQWVKKTKSFSFAHIKELVISVIIFGGDIDKEEKRLRDMYKVKSSKGNSNKMGFD